MIDLRSDTVTQPCDAMRKAMATAEVGDDVYHEDPTVARLQSQLAEMTGQEAGLFFPSGTQSNLAALLAHCQRGEEFIVGQEAHTYKYEAGGAAVLGSIQPQPMEFEADGTLNLDKVQSLIKEDDYHFAKTRLLALENTKAGKVLPMDYLDQAEQLARSKQLSFHLDGARVFNAAVGLGVEISDITQRFDSVSICLSKGLGAPVGSVLVAKQDIIDKATRWRKMVGGGMRQVGILAAAGLYAIENNVERLAEDHEKAALLADQLSKSSNLEVIGGQANTNMVFLNTLKGSNDMLMEKAAEQGVLFGGGDSIRLVTHKDLTEEDVLQAAETINELADSS